MRRVSKKTAARVAECKPFRDALIAEVGCCEVCLRRRQVRPGKLCVHEIARGSHRHKAVDKRFALLVLCDRCHLERIHGNEQWPQARQLAVLKRSRPADYDLAAFLNLKNPNALRAITEEEVQAWLGLDKGTT